MNELTQKEKTFIDEYLIDFNATRAAIKAGYSKKTARTIACQTLARLHIQAEINKGIDARSERVVIKQDRVIYELSKIAFSDIANYIDLDGGSITVRDMSDIDTSVLSEISEHITPKGTNFKIKLNDKLKALELLGRHLGMFSDKLDLSNKDGSLRPIVNINIPDNNTKRG